MTQALNRCSPAHSRLLRLLGDLTPETAALPHRHFSDRLGQLISLADSVKLAAVRRAPATAGDGDAGGGHQDVVSEFLRARGAIISQLMRAFSPGSGPTRHRWPAAEPAPPASASSAAAPYLRFYGLQQADLEVRIRGLHLRTREAIGHLSPRLQALCALDRALGDILASQHRHSLAAVPRLLARRLEWLFEDDRDTDASAADARWARVRDQYRREARDLLLAEIELRLMPTLGLVKALDDET